MVLKLTTKGIEVEQYVGCRDTGTILPLSPVIKKALPDFMTEPDARNIEYATEPSVDYKGLMYEILSNRMRLRDFLSSQGDYTIIPGSCISHEFDQSFKFSDPDNPYYKIIRDRYQTSIVTASLHINFGAPDSESSLAVSNAMRLIASQVLAISASSPFHNGKVTGFKSYRWHSFPKTPKHVPIFEDLAHFIRWNEEKIAEGDMFNVRHLWCASRPNGPTRPQVLNRVELRIPDLILPACKMLGMTSYLEMRFLKFLEGYYGGGIDNEFPKILKSKDIDLVSILDENEERVAKDGFDAKIFDFITESEICIRDQIDRDYGAFKKMAGDLEISETYKILEDILDNGNFSSHMLKQHEGGKSISEILVEEALKQEDDDKKLFNEGELNSTCKKI